MTQPYHNKNTQRHNPSLATTRCDVLIIGAGLAGLSTALSLPRDLQVIVLAKEGLQDCSSHYAQGGIAAAIDKKDSVADHVSDTLVAGDGLCDIVATTQLLQQGSRAIDWLLAHNVPFTNTADTLTSNPLSKKSTNSLSNIDEINSETATHHHKTIATPSLAELHLTQEGGHGCRRVAHADDATGKYIMQSLLTDIAQAKNIKLLLYSEAVSLIIDKGICQGAMVVNQPHQPIKKPLSTIPSPAIEASNTLFNIESKTVVLASGGLGQLFSRATAANVCMGDGIMMAWEAGCRLANLEFVQFHPTGLAISNSAHDDKKPTGFNPERNFLISEALRGEGAYLLDPISSTRFMADYDERAELAPRDIVARAIANEISKNGLGYVHLDISHQPTSFIKAHFPDIYHHCLTLGIDITQAPIPVAPTAHYTCGGVMTTATGQTDIKGLYAAGEVAHTGLHGANRLASNSLLECVVVGRAVAKHIPCYLADNQNWPTFEALSQSNNKQASFVVPTPDLVHPSIPLGSADCTITNFAKTINLIEGAIQPTLNYDVEPKKRRQLKQLMTEAMGIRRTQQQLSAALKQIGDWQQQGFISKSNLDHVPSFNLAQMRWQRLLNLASLMLLAASSRLESRGGHYRNDYPTPSNTAAISIIYPLQHSFITQTTTSANSNSGCKHEEEKSLVFAEHQP